MGNFPDGRFVLTQYEACSQLQTVLGYSRRDTVVGRIHFVFTCKSLSFKCIYKEPTRGREQLELFLAPTHGGKLWQTSRVGAAPTLIYKSM